MTLFSLCLFMLGCNSHQPSPINGTSLLTLDLLRDYPLRKVDIHDIADVEYIPLETNDSSLLTDYCGSLFISDKYIITFDPKSGNIFFFNRSGKHLWTMNRHGGSSEEYVGCNLTVDFDAEECFVHDDLRDNMLVYTFRGDFKRSFKLPRRMVMEFHNYDKEYLLLYNKFFDYRTQKCDDDHPYYLMSKQDGTFHSIDLDIKNRITHVVHAAPIVPGGRVERVYFRMNSILLNGSDALIGDFTLDTIYRFVDRKLVPMAVRTPSVRATKYPMVVSLEIYSDSFLCFTTFPFYYNPSNPYEAYLKKRFLACNRHTGKIEEWEMYDSNYSVNELWNVNTVHTWEKLKNSGWAHIRASTLLNRYKSGTLKGELKRIASGIKEDDNDVLILCHFK